MCRWVWPVVTLLVVAVALPALAHAGGSVLPLFAQEDATPVAIPPARSYWLDILIVVVLFGGALFAVCRASRRS